MTSAVLFEPRWASIPGDTIVAALRERGLSAEDLADLLHIPDRDARSLVRGELPITKDIASGLSGALGGSSNFWMNRERQYQENLAWVTADQLARVVPFEQMVNFGWIADQDGWRERAAACLEFFDVRDATEWNARYGGVLDGARYRASPSFEADDAAVATWLRRAEIEATQQAELAPWSPKRFRQAVDRAKYLSKLADPNDFGPALQRLCAAAGVAVVILRAPKGCSVSGASSTTSEGVRIIALSARHLSDDHFWFTFFHEAGHVLLHEAATLFVDGYDEGATGDSSEIEADAFAQDALIAPGYNKLGTGRAKGPTMRDVLAYASTAGIAPGLVVGQLQHAGRLGFNQLNGLKRHYKWDGSTLKI